MSHDSSNCFAKLLFPALAVCTLSGITFAQDASRPNILIILADDMSTDSVAAFNPTLKVPTPNLDQLVSQVLAVTPFGQANHSTKKVLAAKDPFTQLGLERIFRYVHPFLDVLAVGSVRVRTTHRSIPVSVQQIILNPIDSLAGAALDQDVGVCMVAGMVVGLLVGSVIDMHNRRKSKG